MKWADHYWHGIPCMKVRVEELARRCYGKVLEVGSNDGFVAQCIREQGMDVTALELSDEAIARAKAQFGDDFPIQKGDVCALPFEDASFDTVVAGELLEHLDNPGKGLTEIFRVSKARVILSLPIGHYWLGEPTHLWELKGMAVEHDRGELKPMIKELMILEWNRWRRWENGVCQTLPNRLYDPNLKE